MSTTDPEAGTQPPSSPVVLKAEQLFRTGPIVWIEVGQDRYQLRLTRNGKLILTK